ncbi:sulfite exporter TauE/SafE family protein [Acidianus brierleyi]|uniref:Probable membrane transporter protein n=1 Tax=Acidianus brierleyi TaxID=41673 RepID=A0A2U9IH04_9CREN|nr:sulfite exporter TauE/SafE family protein [Acidianus brierleyi]AWR95256.1 TSUP family transporter [Acidianus brierleyi]
MISIEITPIEYILSIIAGLIVGFSLGLIGGGGSILAVPLLLYFVGLGYLYPQGTPQSNEIDHLVIGTTALAVGLNAYINSFMHFKKGDVKVKQGILFTVPGIVGSFIGASLGLLVHGSSLLFFFGILMIVVAVLMWRNKGKPARPVDDVMKEIESSCKIRYDRILPTGFAVGLLSGFFGIGGGFLIVPGLIFSAGLCMLRAVGTSLIAVGTFGVVSAIRYTMAGEISVLISLLYLAGGVAGGYLGTKVATSIPRGMLRKIFAIIIILVAIYLMYQNIGGLFKII